MGHPSAIRNCEKHIVYDRKVSLSTVGRNCSSARDSAVVGYSAAGSPVIYHLERVALVSYDLSYSP